MSTTAALQAAAWPITPKADRLLMAIANVKDYGALGDGTTDDTAAIQAAIAAAFSAGGGFVYFPHGVYLLASTQAVPAGVHLVGVGCNTGGLNTTVANPTALSMIRWTGGAAAMFTFTSTYGTIIRDISFHGNSVAAIGLDIDRMRFADVRNIRVSFCATNGMRLRSTSAAANDNAMWNVFSNITIESCPQPLRIDGMATANVCHNTFQNLRLYSTLVTSNSADNTTYALYLGPSDNNTFVDTWVSTAGATGIYASGSEAAFTSGQNAFLHLQTPGMLVKAGCSIMIWGYAKDNSQVEPTVEAGATVSIFEYGTLATGSKLTTPLNIATTSSGSGLQLTGQSTDASPLAVNADVKATTSGKCLLGFAANLIPSGGAISSMFAIASVGVVARDGVTSNNITDAAAVYGQMQLAAAYTGTVTSGYGFYAANGTKNAGSGVFTNYYGLYVPTLNVGTSNNFGIRVETNTCYFGGTVQHAGSVIFPNDNTNDIGNSATTFRPRDLFLARNSTVGGHLLSTQTSGTVAAAAGANAGATPPAPVLTACTDTKGSLTFGTGTTPALGAQVAVTFGTAYAVTPVVHVQEQNSATKALGAYISAVSTTGFTVSTASAPAASQANTTYSLGYAVIG